LYRFNKKRKIIIVLSAIVTLLLVYQAYNMSMYVKGYYQNSEITRIFLSLSDVKAGLDKTTTKTITISDQQEIQDIIYVLKQRMLIKILPSFGPVNSNSNDRLELRILVSSTKKGFLEYLITSKCHVEIKKGNDDFSHVLVFNGSALTWFDDLKKIVDKAS